MKIKEISRKIIIILLVSFLITGCTSKEMSRIGIADNEVLTLTEIPNDKMVFTMSTGDGMDIVRIVEAIESKFNNVKIVVKNGTSVINDMENDALQDIILSANPNSFRNAPDGTYIDISSYDFVSNYYLTALNNCESNGRLYYLPGPSTVTGIVYNKDLFAQNSWQPATSQAEFIELCKKIEATGIRALQPTIRYNSAARLLFSGFTYADSFGGVEGYQWFEDYKVGKSTMVGHMEHSMEIMQLLLNEGIWRASDFEMEPKKRSEMLYNEKTTAMIIETQMAPNYAKQIGKDQAPAIGMMPFFSGNDGDDDYLIADPSFYIGLNGHLQDKGNEERLETAVDILRYISSIKGQEQIISEETPLISNVIGVNTKQSEFLSGVEKTISEGRVVNTPYYWKNQNSQIDVTFSGKLKEFAEGKIAINDVLSACDQARDNLLAKPEDVGEVIGEVSKSFTVMETALYFADAFRQKTDAQIGLCLANARKLGIITSLYKGKIYNGDENTMGGFLNKYFICDDDNKTLKLVKMTGKNIKEALYVACLPKNDYDESYLVASGLKIEFAPWAENDKKIVSVKLEDGSELKDDKIYQVAFWSGVIDDKYISQIVQEYTDDIISIFSEAINKDGGTIKPFNDERFILNWEIIAK